MKKIGMVFGAAVVATLAGCKDPEYNRGDSAVQNDVKVVEAEPAPAQERPIAVEPVAEQKPAPAPAAEPAPAVLPPPSTPVTYYIVQRGDSLSKISKKFNVTISALRKNNPSVKNDVIRIGQKLKLPGKFDVGEQTAPKGSFAKPAPAKKTAKAPKAAYTPYNGATKEYAVKSGDTLGSIAYSNGINIRQLKELNKLSSDKLSIGQKLQIPAEKVVAKKVDVPVDQAVKAPAVEQKPIEAAPVEVPAPVAEPAAVEPAPEAAPVAEPATAPAAEPVYPTYTVQEGDDLPKVAVSYGVPAAVLRELNGLDEDVVIKPGDVLKLPPDVQQ